MQQYCRWSMASTALDSIHSQLLYSIGAVLLSALSFVSPADRGARRQGQNRILLVRPKTVQVGSPPVPRPRERVRAAAPMRAFAASEQRPVRLVLRSAPD